MQSKIIQADHDDLINLSKAMTPEQRLVAFYHHSFLLNQLYLAGMNWRKNSSQTPSKELSPNKLKGH